jgi:glycosyltransferase involved in cell wall biosynthesis
MGGDAEMINVLFISKEDWANSGWKMCEAVNRHSRKYHLEYFVGIEHPYGYYRGDNILTRGGFPDYKAINRLAEYQYDVIHVKIGQEVPIDLYGVEVDYSKPSVLTVGTSGIWFEQLYKEVSERIKWFSKVVCTTPNLLRDNWTLLPFALDETRWTPIEKVDDCVIIGHSPSSKTKKGTGFVVKAVEKLSRRYPVYLNMQYGMPHRLVMEYKKLNHIFVDQLIDENYANSAVEAMAFGSAVVASGGKGEEVNGCLFGDKDSLEGVLDKLIIDKEWRGRVQNCAYKHFLATHSYPVIANKVERIYDEVLSK